MRTVQEDTADGLPFYTHAKLSRSFYEILYSAHHVILRFSSVGIYSYKRKYLENGSSHGLTGSAKFVLTLAIDIHRIC
ncbi:hypothetical protein PsorP6_006284 [Peronosclerospora sorghi]|uniref:Uncharacterized protein n=1 Tax=Peronosclerospora sorghi TaxID=230839 RepID=A0ACC0W5I3_9STRA|nr:hypothetical protein PsorP6_006284 [Peronosclerospora sorghi]